MKVHHLNCATLCPVGAKLALPRGHMVCHCLLVETDAGLVLVDTGFGTADLAEPRRRLGGPFVTFVGPRLDPEETALRQIARLGFQRDDVRHLVLTHLDVDHAGALGDFPDASVHVLAAEEEAARLRRTFLERARYRPAQWAHGPRWVRHEPAGEPWFGFACVRALAGLPPEILLVPLVGHTRGHAGVAVSGPEGWLLHCGDAYFHRGELAERPRCPPALEAFQRLVEVDGAARRANRDRLGALARAQGSAVRIFCAHDPDELPPAPPAE